MPAENPIDIKINIQTDYDPSGAEAAKQDALSLQQSYAHVPTVTTPAQEANRENKPLPSALATALEATRPENMPEPDIHPEDLIDSQVLRALSDRPQKPPLRIEVANAIYKRVFEQGRQAQDLEYSDLETLLDPMDQGAAFSLAAKAWEQGKAERCTILPFGPEKLAEIQKQAVSEFLEIHSTPAAFDDADDELADGSPSPFAPQNEYEQRVLAERFSRQSEDDIMDLENALEEATRTYIRRIRKEVLTPEENARLKDADILKMFAPVQEAAQSAEKVAGEMEQASANAGQVPEMVSAAANNYAQIATKTGEQKSSQQEASTATEAIANNTQAAADAAQEWLAQLEPPHLQAGSEEAQQELDNLAKAYKRAAKKASEAAEKGDTKALERAKRSMETYAKGMHRLAKKPSVADRFHKSAMRHLKDAQGSAAQSSKEEKKSAKAAKDKAAANRKAADAAKKQIPKGQPAKTTSKVASLSAQVKDQKAQIERLTNEVKNLCGKVSGLGDAAAGAATVAAQAATAADRAIDRTKKEIAECRKAIERLNRQ